MSTTQNNNNVVIGANHYLHDKATYDKMGYTFVQFYYEKGTKWAELKRPEPKAA